MKPAVMLPTYNEAENLRKITESILRVAPEMTVVVVDDESPDGTGRIADGLFPGCRSGLPDGWAHDCLLLMDFICYRLAGAMRPFGR